MTPVSSIDVLLHLPGAAPRKVPATSTATIGEMLDAARVEPDLLLIGEDDEADEGDYDVDPKMLGREQTLQDVARGRLVAIHCHRCRHVSVTVNYQKETLHRRFPPSTRARKVLRWAKRKLKLADADADNLALFRCEGGEQVRETTHLGELVTGTHCDLCFDMSKDHNIEGAA
jgi:hypothetical protein